MCETLADNITMHPKLTNQNNQKVCLRSVVIREEPKPFRKPCKGMLAGTPVMWCVKCPVYQSLRYLQTTSSPDDLVLITVKLQNIAEIHLH